MKRLTRLTILLYLFALLSGCGLSSLDVSQNGIQAGEVRDMLEFRAPIYTDAEPVLLWGRQQLSGSAQRAYDQLSEAIACHREDALEVDVDSTEIQQILTALRIDHPEYFWFDGEASFVTSTLAGVEYRTECTLSYTKSLEELQEAHQQVQQFTAACLSSPEVAGAQSDYDKILGVYRYIIEHTDYVLAETDQSIISVMGRQKATCAGYSRTFQYLMTQLGIPCTLALGEGEDGVPHGWNMVQCDGSWYQIDVTWGDPVDSGQNPGSGIQYTYCLVTDDEIYRDHTLVSEIPMPVCTSTADNYFIREGRYFETWDGAVYASAMAQAVNQGENWFSVRFSSLGSYEAAREALFGEGKIWDMLTDCGIASLDHVTYTQNDQFYEISVQLGGTGEDET